MGWLRLKIQLGNTFKYLLGFSPTTYFTVLGREFSHQFLLFFFF